MNPILKIITSIFFLQINLYSVSWGAKQNTTLEHRKGTIVIKTNAGKKVIVNQVRHNFWFGTAISNSIFTNQVSPSDKKKYLTILKTNFNAAVHENALKWYTTEPRQGAIDYSLADTILQWCMDNNMPMRGHCVFWDVSQFVQNWIKKIPKKNLTPVIASRAQSLLTHFQGRIGEYDVNNEMIHGKYYSQRLGRKIYHKMFVWCAQADPQAILYTNDYGILSGDDFYSYVRHIKSLIKQGTPIGGIGIQGHFTNRVDVKKVKRILDKLSQFNLPIKITEFDMKTLDEQAKAKGLENLYRVCFAHPSVEGIFMWGFWAGAHWLSTTLWGIPGYTALWDQKWQPTPAAKVYQNLVYKEWWTNYDGFADENGICEVQAFYGTHKVKVDTMQQLITIDKENRRKVIELVE